MHVSINICKNKNMFDLCCWTLQCSSQVLGNNTAVCANLACGRQSAARGGPYGMGLMDMVPDYLYLCPVLEVAADSHFERLVFVLENHPQAAQATHFTVSLCFPGRLRSIDTTRCQISGFHESLVVLRDRNTWCTLQSVPTIHDVCPSCTCTQMMKTYEDIW